MIFFFKLLVLFSSLSSDERYSTSNSWPHGSFCRRIPRPFLKRGSDVGESGLFYFLGGQRQDRDPLSLAKSLQQELAAVFETHRVAIRVHLGTDLHELHLLHFSRRMYTKEFKLAAVQRLEQGVSLGEVARALEVNPNVLHRWRRRPPSRDDL